jgi:hypothetical protein
MSDTNTETVDNSATVNMAAMLDAAIAQRSSGTKKKKGLGLMWGEATSAVGNVASTLSTLAQTGNELAVQAKAHAVIGKAEAYTELLTTFGIESQGMESVILAQKLLKLLEE